MSDGTPLLLAQNRRLSAQEITRAVEISRTVGRLEESRAAYVAERQLDPAFCLPGGNYDGSESGKGPTEVFRRISRHLLENPEHFNRLRLFSFIFTGFSLLHYRRSHGVGQRLWEVLSLSDAEIDERLSDLVAASAGDNNFKIWHYQKPMTPDEALFVPPPICGEVGLDLNGVIVNHDTVAYQERLLLLHKIGLLEFLREKIDQDGVARVLEIGGGYGALARQIKQLLPQVAYTICDLPEAMYFSAPYLALALPELETHFANDAADSLDSAAAIHFVPNYAFPVVAPGKRFDLVINTLSMSELSPHQVQTYGAMISRAIGGTGLFFEQNYDNTPQGLINCKDHLPRHFLRRSRPKEAPFFLAQGEMDVWSNRSIQLPYRRAAPAPTP